MSIVRVAAFAVICALAGTGVAHAASPPHEPPAEKPIRTIAINVNGEPLDTDTPPQVIGGRVLVPLRDVFGALGIGITRAGKRIDARLPTGSVSVQLGSPVAQVNGTSVTLEAPVVEAAGTVYVPLRLIIAALGAQATYDQRGAKIEIVSAYIGRQSGAEQQRTDGGTDVQGVVSAIDSNSQPPSLTVVRGGTSRTISITSDAKLWIEDVTIHTQLKADFTNFLVGDAIHAILAKDGRVISVFDFYKSTNGTVAAVSPTAIVLTSGRVVTPSSNTEITLNSVAVKLSDLRAGDVVTVRSNPESGELRQIVTSRALAAQPATPSPSPGAAASVPAANAATIESVALSANRPLRAGESFDVVMKGTPRGRASFDIGDYLTDQPMKETMAGTYVGRYTIPDRFNATKIPVYGKLSVGSSSSPRQEAAQTLSAATTPPTIGEFEPSSGQTVNNARPSIFATYAAPTEIPINQSSVSLNVNGHDVTASATRTASFVTYSPGVDLPSGPVTVIVRVSDAAGNAATRTWIFTIQTR